MKDQDLCGKLLAAQLFRLSESDNISKRSVRAADFKLIPSYSRNIAGTHRLIAFSGVFIDKNGVTTLPFTVSFTSSARGLRAVPPQFCAAGIGTPLSRILAMLSVIDYLESVDELSRRDGLEQQVSHMTKGGALTERSELCAAYPTFRERAIKSLPYDDSLLLLGAKVAA